VLGKILKKLLGRLKEKLEENIETRELTEKKFGYRFVQKFFVLGKSRWKIFEKVKKPVFILKTEKF